MIDDTDGKQRLLVEDMKLGGAVGFGSAGAAGARDGHVDVENARYEQGQRGGFDPHARIVDMDGDEIDAAFLYPSVGLFIAAIKDPGLSAALCRAYNRWLKDYCSAYPDRLFGVAMLPFQSIDLAIQELRFAREDLGMRAAFLRPEPRYGRTLHDLENEPIWSTAEELDVAIALHAGGHLIADDVGVNRFQSRGARHMASHTVEMMLAALSIIWEGVCDRHERLRVGFMESGGGWMAGWLDRMDRHFDDHDMRNPELMTRPSELFRRNCWISFEPVEGSLTVLADYLGPEKILWATDYPHPDGFFPGAPKLISERPLLPEVKHGILAGGAMRFYGLTGN